MAGSTLRHPFATHFFMTHSQPAKSCTDLERRLAQARGQLLNEAADLGIQDDTQGGALLGGRSALLPQRRRSAVTLSLFAIVELVSARARKPQQQMVAVPRQIKRRLQRSQP